MQRRAFEFDAGLWLDRSLTRRVTVTLHLGRKRMGIRGEYGSGGERRSGGEYESGDYDGDQLEVIQASWDLPFEKSKVSPRAAWR